MRFPTMLYVRPAKAQISLYLQAVWSEPLQVAWIFYDCWATDRTSIGVSKLKPRLLNLIWVYTCQNATLLEITCPAGFAQPWKVLEYTWLSWKVLENKICLESTWKTLKSHEKSLNFTICKRIQRCFLEALISIKLWCLYLVQHMQHQIKAP